MEYHVSIDLSVDLVPWYKTRRRYKAAFLLALRRRRVDTYSGEDDNLSFTAFL